MKESLLFQRGGDINRNIGIGQVESLKYKLQSLKEHPAVEMMYTEKGVHVINNRTAFSGMVFNLRVNLSKTDCETLENFLLEYLDPRFFIGAEVQDEGYFTGISEYLGNLRRSNRVFFISYRVNPEYENDFPEIYKKYF